MNNEKNCPCGSKNDYWQCCGAFIERQQLPQTAEALMRSRYTAYSQAKINYIQQTMLGEALQGFDPLEAEQFAKKANWQGLTVIRSLQGQANDDMGYVEFIARYQLNGQPQVIHELSEFRYINGRWYYVTGKPLAVSVTQTPLIPDFILNTQEHSG